MSDENAVASGHLSPPCPLRRRRSGLAPREKQIYRELLRSGEGMGEGIANN